MKQPNSITDPGRILLHALVYLAKHASLYPIEAWANAENILYRAHNEFEDDDRIEFVRYMEEQERSDRDRDGMWESGPLIEAECGI